MMQAAQDGCLRDTTYRRQRVSVGSGRTLSWIGSGNPGPNEELGRPIARGMCGRVEVENTAPMMLDHEEAVEYAKTQRRHGEEVERGNHLAMVLQERQPALYLCLVGLTF